MEHVTYTPIQHTIMMRLNKEAFLAILWPQTQLYKVIAIITKISLSALGMEKPCAPQSKMLSIAIIFALVRLVMCLAQLVPDANAKQAIIKILQEIALSVQQLTALCAVQPNAL